jgi:arylformamidase
VTSVTHAFSVEPNKRIYSDVSYGLEGAGNQKLDLYLPQESIRKAPVHVYVHGGAWTKGDKDSLKIREVKSYLDHGIIVASLNYNLQKYPDNLQDIAKASQWLNNNIAKYDGDPNNMVLSGHSAGAHLVALLGVKEHVDFKAIFPVDSASYDLSHKTDGGLIGRWIARQKRIVFGDNVDDLKKASPIYQVRKDGHYPPFHIYVTAERSEAVTEAKRFNNILKNAGQVSSIIVLDEDLSHADMKKEIFHSNSPIFKGIIKVLN